MPGFPNVGNALSNCAFVTGISTSVVGSISTIFTKDSIVDRMLASASMRAPVMGSLLLEPLSDKRTDSQLIRRIKSFKFAWVLPLDGASTGAAVDSVDREAGSLFPVVSFHDVRSDRTAVAAASATAFFAASAALFCAFNIFSSSGRNIAFSLMILNSSGVATDSTNVPK